MQQQRKLHLHVVHQKATPSEARSVIENKHPHLYPVIVQIGDLHQQRKTVYLPATIVTLIYQTLGAGDVIPTEILTDSDNTFPIVEESATSASEK
jgi:hypothetical protein